MNKLMISTNIIRLKYIALLTTIVLCVSCNKNKKKLRTDGETVITESPIGQNKKVIELNQKGIEFSEKNELDKAEKSFLKALEIEPNNYVVLSNYGLYKTLIGEFDESIQLMEKSLTLSDSTYLTSAVNLSRSYYFNKNYEKGINIATFVINKTDDRKVLFQAYVHRIGNYIASKKCETAINEKNKINELFRDLPNADFHFKKIEKLYKKNCGQQHI